MVLAAGFFVTFLLFLALGLGALLVTAALDKSIGKERGLFLWAFALLAVAFLLRAEAPKPSNPAPKSLTLSRAADPSAPLDLAKQVFARTELSRGTRNAFQEQSDTRALPPERLPEPPPVALAFPLPPTIPGIAPAGRRAYRGEVPKVVLADGSKLPDVPPDAYVAWTPQPEDVFDWIVQNGVRNYVYLRSVDGVKEGSEAWDDPQSVRWNLALQGAPPTFDKAWRDLQVEFAYIGTEEQARKVMATPRKARGQNVATLKGDAHEWFLRRTVDNLFVESCRRAGSPRLADLGVDGLRAVATDMATLGGTGKEDGKGWRRAIEALELALSKGATAGRDPSDVLEALIDAYRAVHDETRLMAALASFLSSASGNAAAKGATWVGDLFLQRLRLADRADVYYGRALGLSKGLKGALVGRGDALVYLGDHEAALKLFRQASDSSGRGELAVREGEALLRLGDLAGAAAAADQALAADAYDVRALLVKGAAQYASGDPAGARETFAQASVLPGDGAAGAVARRHRAEALYDLGLAEWRLGHGDAATAAFDAAEKALRAGAQRGRHPDETVSPELGRALLALGLGNTDEASAGLDRAREQAERCAYVEVLAGFVARQQGDAPRARGRFEAALALAPDYHELDGWLAETRLAAAQLAVNEGRPLAEAGADFLAAVRFAERAAATEFRADPKSTEFAVRLALTQIQAQHLRERDRFEGALRTAEGLLARVRDERRALAVKGYCNYRLGVYDATRYDQCLRDFQAVLDAAAGEGDPWRAYAAASRKTVTRWLSLEEKTVEFAENQLSTDWDLLQSHGIRVGPDEGWLVFRDQNRTTSASDDGSETDPTVAAKAKKLFGKESLETVQVWLSIPRRDTSVNKVTFGVVVQPPSGGGKGLSKNAGVGVFYRNGKVALRVGGGTDPLYKDGALKTVQKDGVELEWPDDGAGGTVLVEIQRSGDDGTQLTLRLNGTELLSDRVPAFRRAKAEQELWLGGWSAKAEKWDLRVDKVRVVRTK